MFSLVHHAPTHENKNRDADKAKEHGHPSPSSTIASSGSSPILIASAPSSTPPSPDLEYIDPSNLPPVFCLDESFESNPLFLPPAFSPARPAQVTVQVEQYTDQPPISPERLKLNQQIASVGGFNIEYLPPKRPLSQDTVVGRVVLDEDKFNTFQAAHNDKEISDKDLTAAEEGELKDPWDDQSVSDWTDEDTKIPNRWPTPTVISTYGDENHPPSFQVCGAHPGNGFELNALNTDWSPRAYKFLIPDPLTGRMVLAPFIRYNLIRSNPQISATYGQGYPIHTRSLEPTPVDYLCPHLTPEQLKVFDTQMAFAPAVDKVVEEQFPADLAAGVRQYQYYKDTQYSIQKVRQHLHNKENAYLEKAIETLDSLERANVLGRLLAHLDVITQEFTTEALKPEARLQFIHAIDHFDGDIPRSAQDTRANPSVNLCKVDKRMYQSRLSDKEINHLSVKRPPPFTKGDIIYYDDDDDTFGARSPLPWQAQRHAAKRCHKCRKLGHIRQQCPRRRAKLY
jgi:hypothetical protein